AHRRARGPVEVVHQRQRVRGIAREAARFGVVALFGVVERCRRVRGGRGVQRRRRLGAAGAAALDRLTDVLDVGPPCPGLAVWHALSVLFPGLTGLADGLALKESRYAEGDSPQ